MGHFERVDAIATKNGTIKRFLLTWVTCCDSWTNKGAAKEETKQTTALTLVVPNPLVFLLSLSLSKTQNPKPNRNSASRVRATYGPLDYAASVLPCVRWLSTYSIKSSLLFDVLAGASVAALVVPQGMSYARLAGLPQEYGLYGAFVPVMVYAALGSSRHLVSWQLDTLRKGEGGGGRD